MHISCTLTLTVILLTFRLCLCAQSASKDSVADASATKKDTVAKEEKPAMELGGNCLVDYLAVPNKMSHPTLEVGQVELGAKVNISDEVVASVVLKTWSKLDSIWIDQAVVSYKPGLLPLEFLFGQQTFNSGLLTNRLISFPLIYNYVDFRKPGLIVNSSVGKFKGGLGITTLPADTVAKSEAKNLYSGVVNIDATLPNDGIVRLSMVGNEQKADLDLCGTINYWKLSFDFEGLMRMMSPVDSINPSGFYSGVLWNINDRFGAALRVDGFSKNNFKAMTMQYTGGVTINIKDGIYCAVEYSRNIPEGASGSDLISVEFGLVQKIQLPGFQRKSLSRE